MCLLETGHNLNHTEYWGPVQTSYFCRVEFNTNEQKPLFELISIKNRRDRNMTFEVGLSSQEKLVVIRVTTSVLEMHEIPSWSKGVGKPY